MSATRFLAPTCGAGMRFKARLLKAGVVLYCRDGIPSWCGWIVEDDETAKATRKPQSKYPSCGYGGYTVEELERLSKKFGGTPLI